MKVENEKKFELPELIAGKVSGIETEMKDAKGRLQFVAAAIFAVVALVLVMSACTFTGVKAEEVRPLTGPEFAYFNEEFFNSGDFNIRNQFLSSIYEAPEDIDLYELFYCGIPDGELSVTDAAPESDEELRQVYGDTLPDCATYKLTTAEMDALLSKYTGLTMADTNRVNLQEFTYLPEYDAYYFAHGDTNYRGKVTITAGEREGDLARLYYNDTFMADGWKCVTLREEDGSYHFVSNQSSEKPAIPIVLPEGNPVLTISLEGLEPYQAPEVTVERHTDDCVERLDGWMAGDYTIRAYRSTDGNRYAAVVYEEAAGNGVMTVWDVGCFLTLPEEGSYSVDFFSDLFGHNGIVISYPGTYSEREGTTFNDYYYVTGDGAPVLLARAYGASEIVDLDGDGENELTSNAIFDTQIFFQRSGQVYRADLPALLAEAWPEMSSWDYAIWDANGRYLAARGFVTMPGWEGGSAYFLRYLYFNGESLLVYKDDGI